MINVYVDTREEMIEAQAAFEADVPGGLDRTIDYQIEFRHPQNHPDGGVRAVGRNNSDVVFNHGTIAEASKDSDNG